MKTLFLTSDIRSLLKPSLIYGRVGDRVLLVRDCTGVLIVDKNGFRFPVKPEFTSAQDPAQEMTSEETPAAEIQKPAPAIRKKRAQHEPAIQTPITMQGHLF